MTNQPTTEQLAALKAFAAKHGKNWKNELSTAWMKGTEWKEPGDNGPYLREVRNQLGPSWLHSYRLEAKEA